MPGIALPNSPPARFTPRNGIGVAVPVGGAVGMTVVTAGGAAGDPAWASVRPLMLLPGAVLDEPMLLTSTVAPAVFWIGVVSDDDDAGSVEAESAEEPHAAASANEETARARARLFIRGFLVEGSPDKTQIGLTVALARQPRARPAPPLLLETRQGDDTVWRR